MNEENDTWSRAEAWIAKILAQTGLRWTRRAPGWFCQSQLGLRIALEEPERETVADALRDSGALFNQAVLVIPVKAFDEQEASAALRAIALVEPWNDRRQALGLNALPGAESPLHITPRTRRPAAVREGHRVTARGRADRAHGRSG